MASPKPPPMGLYLTVFPTQAGVVLGAIGTVSGIIQLILLALPFVAGGVYCFFTYFEIFIRGLWIVRTSLEQLALPLSVLPPMLVYGAGNTEGLPFEAGSGINGTLGHPNTFTTFLVLFRGLTYWKQQESTPRWPRAIALAVIAFLFGNTKSLFGLIMVATLIGALIAPKLSLPSLLGGIVGFGLIIALFGSTEFGQERLGSLGATPLGNPDMELWRAIVASPTLTPNPHPIYFS